MFLILSIELPLDCGRVCVCVCESGVGMMQHDVSGCSVDGDNCMVSRVREAFCTRTSQHQPAPAAGAVRCNEGFVDDVFLGMKTL